MVMRVASFLPFQTTYYLNGHSFIEQVLAPVWIRIFLPVFCRVENATWAAAGVICDFS